jgi:hypothetical protein
VKAPISEADFDELLRHARKLREFYKSPAGKWWAEWMEFWRALGGHVAQLPCAICGMRDPENIRQEGDLCDACWYGMRLEPERWEQEMVERGVVVEYRGGCVPFNGGIACRDPYVKGGAT